MNQSRMPTTGQAPCAGAPGKRCAQPWAVSVERVTAEDRFIALGPRRNDVDRDFAQRLDALQIGARRGRQGVERSSVAPTVDSLQPGIVSRIGSQAATSSAPIGSSVTVWPF